MTTYRSQDSNESVPIDLTERYDAQSKSEKIICHIFNEFSRLSAACFIENKKPQNFFKVTLSEWISKFQICEKLLHDLGGQSNGKDLRELLGSMGVRTTSTVATSPFSKGIVERHNSALK